MDDGHFILALDLLTRAKAKGWGDLANVYSWDPTVEKRLEKALVWARDGAAAEKENAAEEQPPPAAVPVRTHTILTTA